MSFIKIKFFISLLILINGCGISQDKSSTKKKFENIRVETPNTKFDLMLKKHLNRTFNYKPTNVTKFILKSKISSMTTSSPAADFSMVSK